MLFLSWWQIDKVKEVLLELERKALKTCLGVKMSTPTDIIYTEINRPDIVSCVKDRQFHFYKKMCSFTSDEALVKDVMEMCKNTNMTQYYRNLDDNHKTRTVSERMIRMNSSTTTMTKRYMDITAGKFADAVYDSDMNEEYRCILTRWRLSCFDLAIETGRYKKIPRDQRICSTCYILEDEYHAIFVCRRYKDLRSRFVDLFSNCSCVNDVLHPTCPKRAKLAGNFLKMLEDIRKGD